MVGNASRCFRVFYTITNAIANVSTQQMLQTSNEADSDFLNALLTGSDSVSGSPLWSPTPSDSGISEDSPSDQGDSPQRPESPQGHAQYFAPPTNTSLKASFPSKSQFGKQAFLHTDYTSYRSVAKDSVSKNQNKTIINVYQTLKVIRTFVI